MRVYQGIHALDSPLKGAVVCIGNFDGVHVGHQHIVETAVEGAKARGGTSVVYTFRPHPQIVLYPEKGLKLLCHYDEKLELLSRLGVDCVIEEPFSREFSVLEPEAFVNENLVRRIDARAVVVGYDFSFGSMRKGNLSRLEALCRSSGVEITVVPPQRVGDETASSSRIREHLAHGQTGSAARLLGRRYSLAGHVVKGDGRGRKLGFPTANLSCLVEPVLKPGVYATLARAEGSAEEMASVTNVGTRPTFHPEASRLLVETHVLDREIDLYGAKLTVELVKYLREERRFSSVEELRARIAEDIAAARSNLDDQTGA